MKFVFSSKAVGDGFTMARIVKPEAGDFCMRFEKDGLVVFSYDKRRYVRSSVSYVSADVPADFRSEEFYVTPERTSLFDSDLESVTIKINEGSLSVKAEGGGQSRQASLKRRAKRSKRTAVPNGVVPADVESVLAVRKDVIEPVLGHLMCSAVVGKTEEEMRINQIHFYSDKRCAVSTTRFYGTVVRLNDIDVPDFSIIGTDAPAIRTFASRASVGLLQFSQDKNRMYVSDGLSCLSLTRVSGRRPPAVLADNSLFHYSAVIKKDQLSKALAWAGTVVQDEGTSRVRFQSSSDRLVMDYNNEKISDFALDSYDRGELDADFQVKNFKHIVDHIDGDVRISYNHPEDPTLLCLSPKDQPSGFSVFHYMKAMVQR
jgi:hypothetical protein